MRATNATTVVATRRASMIAMLFADGSSIAVSACRSLSTSPDSTATTDSPSASRAFVSSTSASLTCRWNPSRPGRKGAACRTITAVMTLATLAIGTGCCTAL